jgi:hypothetical protein
MLASGAVKAMAGGGVSAIGALKAATGMSGGQGNAGGATGSGNSGNSGGGGSGGGSGGSKGARTDAETTPPAWARRQHEQQRRQGHIHMIQSAIVSGDQGGSGPAPDITDKS